MCGLYLHIPYCRKKCLYCDFYAAGLTQADWGKLTDCLVAELSSRIDELATPIETLYIGGGTPSLMPSKQFHRLIKEITKIAGQDVFDEFTIEANPEDVTSDNIAAWKDSGVNRLSLGIESFHDKELHALGRLHNGDAALRAAETAAKNFTNFSVDLMFAIPLQTMESWTKSVKTALQFSPRHLSAYSLMYEERTALTQLLKQHRHTPTDENLNVEMFMILTRLLSDSGYYQYELSNYALPGYESRHNIGYWRGRSYLGLGPSAHSYDGGAVRRYNPSDLKGYLAFFTGGGEKGLNFYKQENLNKDELREEYVLTRLRLREGIRLPEFKERFGEEASSALTTHADKWISDHMLELFTINSGEPHLRLTQRGIMISDEIISDLI